VEGGGDSAGRIRGASGVAGSLSSSVFLVRSDECAPDGTLLRSVVGAFDSDGCPASENNGVAASIPTRIASIVAIRFMIIPPLAPEERFLWESYITPYANGIGDFDETSDVGTFEIVDVLIALGPVFDASIVDIQPPVNWLASRLYCPKR
jgi:hypothetical protein